MKRIDIKTLVVSNFKGFKEFRADFEGCNAVVSGRNRSGKSSLYDAFVWCLFGKDSEGNQDGNLIPISNGKPNRYVEPTVELVLVVDGTEVTLKRSIHQKMVRKRGTADTVFDGTETRFEIDGVEKRAKDYNEYIASLSGSESVFSLVSKPGEFLKMHWKNQRDILYQIAGAEMPTMQEVAETKEFWKELFVKISGEDMTEWRKKRASERKKMQGLLDEMPVRISQVEKVLPEEKDLTEVNTRLEQIKSRKDELDKQMSDAVKAREAANQAVIEHLNKVHESERTLSELRNRLGDEKRDYERNAKKDLSELTNTIAERSREHTRIDCERDRLIREAESLEKQIEKASVDIEALRDEFIKISSEQLSPDSLICPTCGQDLSEDKINDVRNQFDNRKSQRLSGINEIGKSLKEKIERLRKEAQESRAKGESLTGQASYTYSEIEKLQEELKSKRESINADVENYTKKELEAEIQSAEERVKKLQESQPQRVNDYDNSDLLEDRKQLDSNEVELNKILSDNAHREKLLSEIESLKKEQTRIASEIAKIEAEEFAAGELVSAFNKESELAINKLFTIVQFTLFSYTNNGAESEACEALNINGVPIATTNNADRINAGIDISNTLSRHFGLVAPMWIDNAESVNEFIQTTGQIIKLEVSKEPLKIQL